MDYILKQILIHPFIYLVLFYVVIIVITYTIMLLFSLFALWKDHQLNRLNLYEELNDIQFSKPVSILVPAYNEQQNIIDTVQSLLGINYPEYEIIVINDGSKDKTLNVLIENFKMQKVEKVVRKQIDTNSIRAIYQSTINKKILLVDKENGGKADALNCGINVSKYPFFCSIDGDCILDTNSLLRVMEPIIQSDDVIATGGSVKIANGSDIQMGSILSVGFSTKPLVIMQVIEYFRAFLMGRIAFSKSNMVLIISGAFSVFSKKHVIEAGGYLRNTIGEDMELVVRLHRLMREKKEKKKIVFVPDPVCWTEAPETVQTLRRQRSRWHQGLIESLWKNRQMMLNPKYGRIGMIAFPYYLLIECIGPVVELGGYIYVIYAFFTGQVYFEFAVLLLLLFILYGTLFSMLSIVLEGWTMKNYPKIKDLLNLLILSFTEVLWYKPLTLFFRLEGLVNYFARKSSWGEMTRKGLDRKVGKTE